MALPMLAKTRFTASRLRAGIAAQAARSAALPSGLGVGAAGRRGRQRAEDAPRIGAGSARCSSAHSGAVAAVLDGVLQRARAPATTGCPCGRPRTARGCAPCPAIGMVRRVPVPTPWPSGRPSWNCRSAAWQVAHDTVPLRLKPRVVEEALAQRDGSGRVRRAFDGSFGAAGSLSRLIDGEHGLLVGRPAVRARAPPHRAGSRVKRDGHQHRARAAATAPAWSQRQRRRGRVASWRHAAQRRTPEGRRRR